MTTRARAQCFVLAASIGLSGCTAAAGDSSDAIASMNRGVGLLEQYNYLEAYRIFERLAQEFPAWEAAHVNKGIAALNLQDQYLKVADAEFTRALEINPKSTHALVSRCMLYKHTNRVDEWLRDTEAAEKLDARDPHVAYARGEALIEKGRVDEARAAFERTVKLQPSFSSAFWRLREAFVKLNDPQKMMAAIEAYKRIEASEMGVKFGLKYGEGGKYSLAMRDTIPPGGKGPAPSWKPAEAPVFGPSVTISTISAGPPARVTRPDGQMQAPGMATGDLDGDGALEIVLCGAGLRFDNPQGGTTIHRRAASGAWMPFDVDPTKEQAIACALGDIDGDFDTDLVLAGDGWLHLFLNDGKGKLTYTEIKANGATFAGFPVRLYVLDADSDWDLDIVCLRQEKGADGKVRSRLEILNNNRDGTFQEISAECGIAPMDFPAVELVAADLDGDIDADFLIFDGATGASIAYANDRAWRYHRVEAGDTAPRAPGLISTAGGDLDGDGDQDLILFAGGKLRFWRNAGGLLFEEDAAFTQRFGELGGAAGVVADFVGALQPSLVALGSAGTTFVASADAVKAVPIQLDGGPPKGDISALATVIDPCGAPSLLIYDTERGARLHEITPHGSWLVLDLEGPKKPVPKLERSNAAGHGATVEVRAGTKRARFLLDSGSGGAARSSPRLFCGLGGASSSDYVRVLWPDSVLQSELSLIPGCVQKIKEIERKPTSCPILFAWTGSRYEFVADFLGVGGLGYLELPGIYSKPDPSEYVLLPALAPVDGEYRLDILEPLEECTYLDELRLTAVDHAAGVTVIPEEMFAVKGPAPGFKLLAFREQVFAVSATNSDGTDVTRELRDVDRRYGNRVETDPRFPGLARSAHWIDLDLGDGIGSLLESASRSGRPARPYLFLHGYVEYGYSTSNFAAWQAKAVFRAPSVLVERNGRWVTLRDEWGFPAGYPRYMAIDLAGLLESGDRRLRVETNMDIHWDQAFLADSSEEAEIVVTELDADEAILGFRGFPREESPDGAAPLVYLHGGFDLEAPYKTFPGEYTRFGDVRRLIAKADDGFAILGPGDGLSVSVRAARLPPLAAGRTRTFLARTFGYCKDMDLYTAHPDRVEPLPFRAMTGYPFRTDEAIPAAAAQRAYSREWNTRVVK